jgi:hypothetical protein
MNKRKLRISIFILVGIDLVSKYFFYNLRIGEQLNIITPALNTGISRSLPLPYIIIILVSLIGIGAIIRIYATKKI